MNIGMLIIDHYIHRLPSLSHQHFSVMRKSLIPRLRVRNLHDSILTDFYEMSIV